MPLLACTPARDAPTIDAMSDTPGTPHDFRAEFPVTEQYAFLNHAAVAPIPLATQMAIMEFARDAAEEGPVNYSAWLHSMALARQAAGQLLACEPDDVCFTKSTNHGALIVANSLDWREGDNVVGLEHEFPANMMPWHNLRGRGVEFRVVPERPDHTYSIDDIAAAMDARTRLLAVSWVEYSTGVRNDIAALGALCRERGALFFIDGIQGLGAVPMDVDAAGADFVSADGHKWMLATEGCGILYVRRSRLAGMNLSMTGWCGLRNPQDYDDYRQDVKPTAKRFEEGSHNLMAITALGTSLRLLLSTGIPEVHRRIGALTTRLMERARSLGYHVATPADPEQRAGIVCVSRPGLDVAAVAAELLEKHKIVVAARRGYLRVSPHFYNTEDEVDRFLEALPR